MRDHALTAPKLVDARLVTAKQAARVHGPIASPQRDRCLNCHQHISLPTHRSRRNRPWRHP